MGEVFRRRPPGRRAVMLLLAALLAAAVAVVLLRRPVDGAALRPGWAGTEQAGWIAGIVSAVFSLVGTIAAVQALRVGRADRAPATGRLVQVGRLPQSASWFQDRRAQLDLTRVARTGRTAVLTQVLSGMGGVGKTQLAAQFARRLAHTGELDLLVWITAISRDAILAGYAQAAWQLRLVDPTVDLEQAAATLLNWCERTDRRWLVVLDNLDTPAHAAGWWPPANRHGRTIVTTRRRDAVLAAEGRVLVEVGLFSEAEAAGYLHRAIADPGRLAEAGQLAADLGHLPLAVAQAAAFIRDRGLDCAGYRRLLTDRRRRLDELVPQPDALPDDHRATVAATWALSIDAADAAAPAGLARPVLNLVALLDPNGVPTTLLTTTAVLAYLTEARGTGDVVGVDDVGRALHNLHRLNLITHDPHGGSLRVHALVQRAARDELTGDQLSRATRTAAAALLDQWPESETRPALSQAFRANTVALRDHVGDLLLRDESRDVLISLYSSLGDAGLVRAASDGLDRTIADSLRLYGPDHAGTLNFRFLHAFHRGWGGDAAGAADEFVTLAADCIRVLGPDAPLTLTTRHNIAFWRGEAGDPAGAAEATAEVFADRLRVNGPDHPETLNSRGSLAWLRGQAGDPAGAVVALRELLADCHRLLGPEHDVTLKARNGLAFQLGVTGEHAAAVSETRALVADYIRVLGAEHPQTLSAQRNLASWRGHAGDPAGAADALEQLLATCLRVVGPDHPLTAEAAEALTYWRQQSQPHDVSDG
ncbi:tetratricopeptide repeat protein [Micromonospora antibiotica]|uniref:Tetratricopeptide repeat protein n=1 Tax=Micromonospora antibiotica TaxID=2807623 RepID=A0ABS3V7G7_9ACTN|nr:tetratricopeptide repeat protein [Micromonospora antibiotica]MBO4161535.1 tetratricopeptide repeat protein [Micromonospora antibiotica]